MAKKVILVFFCVIVVSALFGLTVRLDYDSLKAAAEIMDSDLDELYTDLYRFQAMAALVSWDRPFETQMVRVVTVTDDLTDSYIWNVFFAWPVGEEPELHFLFSLPLDPVPTDPEEAAALLEYYDGWAYYFETGDLLFDSSDPRSEVERWRLLLSNIRYYNHDELDIFESSFGTQLKNVADLLINTFVFVMNFLTFVVDFLLDTAVSSFSLFKALFYLLGLA